MEDTVIYNSKNTYSTLNSFTKKTKNVWFVFHGLGYLSRYFLQYFKDLDASENFIVAPQAPSKYYQGEKFKHVGASWLTKEETTMETANVLNYIDAVYKKEIEMNDAKLIVMGYSQGVSIATRWLAAQKIQCDTLLLHSGGIPNELNEKSFEYLEKKAKIIYHYGNEDPYINKEKIETEKQKAENIFNNNLNFSVFNGKHEVDKKILSTLSIK